MFIEELYDKNKINDYLISACLISENHIVCRNVSIYLANDNILKWILALK